MTYEELVSEVKEGTRRIDAKKITDHIAIQVNVEGEAEGAFYIEMLRGNIVVEPYEYYDRDVLLICQASQILEILKGSLDPMEALKDGQIRAEGNVGRLGLLGEIIRKTPQKRRASADKTVSKKTNDKPSEKKTAVKSASAKKTTEEKAASGKTGTKK